MECPNCKAQVPVNALFCGNCGTALVVQNSEVETIIEEILAYGQPLPLPEEPQIPEEPEIIPFSPASYDDKNWGNLEPIHDETDELTPIAEIVNPSYTKDVIAEPELEKPLTATQYFFMLLVGFIPVIGLCYLAALSVSKGKSQVRSFARGALFFFPVAIALAFVFYSAFLRGFF